MGADDHVLRFEGRPLIVRLYGHGRSIEPGDPEWAGLIASFPEYPGVRSVVVMEVERIADSCGFTCPSTSTWASEPS